MIDIIKNILTFENILMMNVGVAAGIIIGCLPGLNVIFAIAVLLPLTFGMPSIAGMYLLLGAYCGAIYGGSISAILINTPGTPSACATVFDGYPLAQQGRAGDALKTALVASVVGGLVSCFALLFFAPQLAVFSIKIQAPEFFALCIFGVTAAVGIAGEQIFKGVIMALLGLLMSTVGIDTTEGTQRLMFGHIQLMAGLKVAAVMLGVFALSEVMSKAQEVYATRRGSSAIPITFTKANIKTREILSHWKEIVMSSVFGVIIGAIPGTGGAICAMFSYNTAKRMSKHPEQFGKGCIEGIVAPECGNNATSGATLIPLLTLGIPGDAAVAVLIGALTMQGITPGLHLFTQDKVWVNAIMGGLFAINILMYFQGALFIRLFANVTRIPMVIMLPCIMILCVVGSFAINNASFDVIVTILIGFLGYVLKKCDYPIAPMTIGLVLGNLAETNLRRALIMSNGSPLIFVTRPISFVILLISFISLFAPLVKHTFDKIRGKGGVAV